MPLPLPLPTSTTTTQRRPNLLTLLSASLRAPRIQLSILFLILSFLLLLGTTTTVRFPHAQSRVGELLTDGRLSGYLGGGTGTGNGTRRRDRVAERARNETLGFERVFYVSLESRTDRQDQMSLMAARTGIKIELEHGVNGTLISPKVKLAPPNDTIADAGWGCWRSHANLWRKVVTQRIQTALILEDDVDWDPNLKDVLALLGSEMRSGSLRTEKLAGWEAKEAPYGLDWDILHLGICFDGFEPRKRYQLYDDPHAPDRRNISGHFIRQIEARDLNLTDDSHFRLITPSWNPSCTIGYAVTNLGAQRLLYNIGGVKQMAHPVDLGMADQEKNGFIKGYTILPPVMTSWKVGGWRDSDIDDAGVVAQKSDVFKMGSDNLRESMRRKMAEELGRYRRGDLDYWY